MQDRDELRRRLRDAEDAQHRSLPALAEVADRIAQGDHRIPVAARHQILGVPDRRQFLRLGGISLLGAAVLAACSNESDPFATSGGVAATLGTDSPEPEAPGQVSDQDLLRTAASLEALAVDVYGKAGGLLTDPAVKDAATLFQDHHRQHLDALNAAVEGSPVTEPNEAVAAQIVEPALATIKDQAGALGLAFALETAAAETYVFAAANLGEPALRAQLMTIGSVEARHRTILHLVLQRPATELFPAGFYRNANPLPVGAVLTE
jgi:rubrerythrin